MERGYSTRTNQMDSKPQRPEFHKILDRKTKNMRLYSLKRRKPKINYNETMTTKFKKDFHKIKELKKEITKIGIV